MVCDWAGLMNPLPIEQDLELTSVEHVKGYNCERLTVEYTTEDFH